MANEILTSTIAEIIPEIEMEARYVAEQESIMRPLVDEIQVAFGTGKTVNYHTWVEMTAAALTEGTAIGTNQVLDTVDVALTIGEVGLKAVLSDFARDTSQEALIATIGRLFGRAVARKMDLDLVALFDGFGTSIGGATTAMTPALMREAIATLNAQGIDNSELVMVVHPNTVYDLEAGATNTFANPNAGVAQDAIMRRGFVTNLFGVDVYQTSRIVETTRVSKGCIFRKDAIGLAMHKEMSLEVARDADLRADVLVGTARYAVGELNDAYGVEMHNQTSLT